MSILAFVLFIGVIIFLSLRRINYTYEKEIANEIEKNQKDGNSYPFDVSTQLNILILLISDFSNLIFLVSIL